MSKDDSDNFATGALYLGAGAAALALGQWLVGPSSPEPMTPAPVSITVPPAALPSAVLVRNARRSRSVARYSREGRTILRDDEAVIAIERVDLGDHRYAITPHETDELVAEIVRLLNRAPSRRDARSKDPPYRQRWLVDERCGYRALLFWTGAPPETARVGDVWVYLEKTANGQITGKRRFRTTDEGHRDIKAALRRALERAGRHDCYDY
jgi:hypothetical protein